MGWDGLQIRSWLVESEVDCRLLSRAPHPRRRVPHSPSPIARTSCGERPWSCRRLGARPGGRTRFPLLRDLRPDALRITLRIQIVRVITPLPSTRCGRPLKRIGFPVPAPSEAPADPCPACCTARTHRPARVSYTPSPTGLLGRPALPSTTPPGIWKAPRRHEGGSAATMR